MAGFPTSRALNISVENVMQPVEERWDGRSAPYPGGERDAAPCRVSAGEVWVGVTIGPSFMGDTLLDAQHGPSLPTGPVLVLS